MANEPGEKMSVTLPIEYVAALAAVLTRGAGASLEAQKLAREAGESIHMQLSKMDVIRYHKFWVEDDLEVFEIYHRGEYDAKEAG